MDCAAEGRHVNDIWSDKGKGSHSLFPRESGPYMSNHDQLPRVESGIGRGAGPR